jgi:protein TonB
VIRVGGQVEAAMVISAPPPVYPVLAKDARVGGTVQLDATIGEDGHIENLKVLSGPPLLINAAVDAVKQWTYRPTILNGKPVKVETQIRVNFELG